MPRKPIVGGNWKCNPADHKTLPELVGYINACDTSKCDVYVCPSNLHVGMVFESFTNGACVAPQNCNFKGCGAYTGELAAEQITLSECRSAPALLELSSCLIQLLPY